MVNLIGSLMRGRWNGKAMPPLQAEEIAILYPRASAKQKEILRSLPERIFQGYNTGASWERISSGKEGSRVGIQTIHASKGLQYRAVILLWAGINPIPSAVETRQEAEMRDRRQLYVGMTRAESFLAITARDIRLASTTFPTRPPAGWCVPGQV